ncbi:hypothetical protein PF004_g12883 [Phytophthora fragariae]|nr:hypothetical protein PF004_g12883 [Phytophthora fragariae]
MWACNNDHVAVAELLLESGASIDRANTFGSNSLVLAVVKGHVDIVKLLRKHGADIGKPLMNGGTTPNQRCANLH